MSKTSSFKKKTYLAFGTIVVLSITLLLTVLRLFSTLDDYDSYVSRVDALKTHVHRVKENENKMFLFDTKNKEFIESGNSRYVAQIDSFQMKMLDEIVFLLEHGLTKDYSLADDFTTLNENFQNYTSLISEVIDKIRTRGFGDLKLAGELESELNVLRLKSLQSDYELVIQEISNSLYDFHLVETEEKANEIMNSLEEYKNTDTLGLSSSFASLQAKFKEFSDITREIGFTGQSGNRASLISSSENILTMCEGLAIKVKDKVDSEKSLLYIGFTGLAGIQVVFAIVFAFGMSSNLISRLNKIKDNLSSLSSGVFPDRIIVENNDELGQISSSINELTDRIEYAANYAREIGQGKLSDEYKEEYSEDAIAKAIMEMQVKLKENADRDRLLVWRTEGLAKFANILQENKDKLESLCFEVISNLVKYMKANQGAFYVVDKMDDGSEILRVNGTYAYEREKFIDLELEKGEGMIGEVWKEGETVVLTEIPEDYFMITSGLGEALPKTILMLPLVYNDEIFGVIEMASFKEINDVELEFLEELGKNIAGTLSGTKVNLQTKLLLDNSTKMQGEMKEQEEMMRQNMEEMQATQDTFEQREQAYMEEIKKLKAKLGM